MQDPKTEGNTISTQSQFVPHKSSQESQVRKHSRVMQVTFTVRMKRWWKEATDGICLPQLFKYIGHLWIFMTWLYKRNDSQFTPEHEVFYMRRVWEH